MHGIYSKVHDVSIHAPAKGATIPESLKACLEYVSIHAPAKGATVPIPLKIKVELAKVSIHAPAKGATGGKCSVFRSLWCFNPRSREGSDGNHRVHGLPCYKFQSTLPRRERRSTASIAISQRTWFQSTLPRRERPMGAHTDGVPLDVSIHAPAKGATVLGILIPTESLLVSIHAPAKGATKL